MVALQRSAVNRAVGALQRQAVSAQDADSLDVQQSQFGDATEPDTLTSPRFVGEPLLEACFVDRARMGVGDRDDDQFQPVSKVQQALIDLGFDLGASGADGIYGHRTATAVKAFKSDQQIGFEQFGDVGPGTMHRLNDIFGPDVPVCQLPGPAVLSVEAAVASPAQSLVGGQVSAKTPPPLAFAAAGTNTVLCNGGLPTITSFSSRIVAKSFIRQITGRGGTGAGTLACGPSRIDVTPELIDMAALTDLLMGETAPDDSLDKHYRMFSSATLVGTCVNGQVVSLTFGTPFVPPRGAPLPDIQTDHGPEGFIQTPPLIITEKTITGGGGTPFKFSWAVKGRPASVAEPGFQLVCPRTSVFIWHRIEGEVDCNGVKNVVVTGSGFPTHRVYIDHTLKTTLPQGRFSNLWIPATADPTLVK